MPTITREQWAKIHDLITCVKDLLDEANNQPGNAESFTHSANYLMDLLLDEVSGVKNED